MDTTNERISLRIAGVCVRCFEVENADYFELAVATAAIDRVPSGALCGRCRRPFGCADSHAPALAKRVRDIK